MQRRVLKSAGEMTKGIYQCHGHMLNRTRYKFRYDIKGIHNSSITIDILQFVLINFGGLFIEK